MSKFIFLSDYQTQIRTEILNVITENDLSIIERAENAAVDEISSYLAAQYDVEKMFAPVYDWAKSDSFKKNDRVRLAPTLVWSVSATFTNGQYLSNANKTNVYRVVGNPVVGTAITNETFFEVIGAFGSYFYALSDIPAATNEIDDESVWFPGDSRSELLLRYVIDVIIYEIHCRINPRNIPEFRIQRRDDAIKFLKLCSDPRNNIQPNFPLKTFEENKGTDVIWNSNPKQTHHF